MAIADTHCHEIRWLAPQCLAESNAEATWYIQRVITDDDVSNTDPETRGSCANLNLQLVQPGTFSQLSHLIICMLAGSGRFYR